MVYEMFKIVSKSKSKLLTKHYQRVGNNVHKLQYNLQNSLYTYAFPMSNIIMLSNIIMGLCVFKLLVSV